MSGENPFNIKNEKKEQPDPLIIPDVKKSSNSKHSNKKSSKSKHSKYKKYPSKSYNNDQIKKLLVGYIEVGKNKWAEIPVGAHIRYIKNDGTFVRGGFVTNHWLNKEGKQFIHIANNLNKGTPNYATWPMAHESVARVFKKPDAKSGIELDAVRGKTAEIIGQINKLVDVVKEQKKRIDASETDIKRLYAVVKKLADKH